MSESSQMRESKKVSRNCTRVLTTPGPPPVQHRRRQTARTTRPDVVDRFVDPRFARPCVTVCRGCVSGVCVCVCVCVCIR